MLVLPASMAGMGRCPSPSRRRGSPGEPVAATKKSNELIAYTYSLLFGLPTTGLRFFTAYTP